MITWDGPKRRVNLRKHGLDFIDAERVFAATSTSSRCERRPSVSGTSTLRTSRTDWARVGAQQDREIKTGRAHPEIDPAHIVRGIVRRGLKPQQAKESISLRVDFEVLGWFRAQGPGWQTRMNAVLRAYKEAASQVGGLTSRSSGRP